jgi:hypothetical protein
MEHGTTAGISKRLIDADTLPGMTGRAAHSSIHGKQFRGRASVIAVAADETLYGEAVDFRVSV